MATALRDPRTHCSPEEWAVRCDLAACYRLAHRNGWDDLIWTHISAAVPGPEHHFLLNLFGLSFDEVTASNLVKIDLDGNVVDGGEGAINRAGYLIHSAIHEARPDIACVFHFHTEAGMAISMLEGGLRPTTQHAMRFHDRIAFHDYEGIVLDADEKERLVADLGGRRVMILRNHGFLTAGRSIGEAYVLMAYLEKAARAQLAAMAACAAGDRLVVANQGVAEHTARQFETDEGSVARDLEWPALVRSLDRAGIDYRR